MDASRVRHTAVVCQIPPLGWRWAVKLTENGKLVTTRTLTLSADGKILTEKTDGMRADGKPRSQTAIYQRVDGQQGLVGLEGAIGQKHHAY